MLPGAVHLRAVNPLCGERLLARNNQPYGGGAMEALMGGASKSQCADGTTVKDATAG
jgi:hypothetical protein